MTIAVKAVATCDKCQRSEEYMCATRQDDTSDGAAALVLDRDSLPDGWVNQRTPGGWSEDLTMCPTCKKGRP